MYIDETDANFYKILHSRGIKNLIGKKRGKLTVVAMSLDKDKKGNVMWKCKCECGNYRDMSTRNFNRGINPSCGICDKILGVTSTDNKSGFLSRYKHMIDRCFNPKNRYYKNYGERGITVCSRWLGNEGFIHFKEDMYESYQKHFEEHNGDTTLDRIDVNSNYCKENCRWLTNKEQQSNRTNNHIVNYRGKTQPLCKHIEDVGINSSTVRNRLYLGWSVDDALSIKPKSVQHWVYNDISLRQYCIENGLNYKTIHYRVIHGWNIEDAINCPSGMRLEDYKNMIHNKDIKGT